MRWDARHIRKARWKRWFAWRPVYCHNKTIWLEKVSYKQTSMSLYGYHTEWKIGW